MNHFGPGDLYITLTSRTCARDVIKLHAMRDTDTHKKGKYVWLQSSTLEFSEADDIRILHECGDRRS